MPNSGLITNRWPAFSKPKDDELLSSWLVRLAMSHGLKLHTFCSLTWPGMSIWNRDVDKVAYKDVISMLSQKTGIPVERVKDTTLAAYEGKLYEKHNPFGNTLWIMPVGVYHRTRTQFGLQFCPLCLAEDREPYFRRGWRLAFITLCLEHKVLLSDRCPKCDAAVNFHRDELGDRHKIVAESMTTCFSCGCDLRDVSACPELEPVDKSEIDFQRFLTDAIRQGWVELREGEFVYSHLYFTGLHQVMRVLVTGRMAPVLREAVVKEFGAGGITPNLVSKNRDIESFSVGERRTLLRMAHYLLSDWPWHFVSVCSANRVWSSALLKDLEPPPFWYWSAVHDYLYRVAYCPSDEEIDSAVSYIRNSGQVLNKKVLSRCLGVTAVHRKRKVWKPDWE